MFARRAAAPLGKAALRRTMMRQQTPRRRMFHDDSQLLQPRFTPGEELMLDTAAWFVAFALCWSPDHDFDDLDYQNMSELQDEANSRKRHNDEQQKQQQQKKDDHKKH